jgi:hypothetical protein
LIWLSHSILLLFIVEIMSGALNIFIISSFVRVFHSLFIYFGPYILRKIFLSHIARASSAFLVVYSCQSLHFFRSYISIWSISHFRHNNIQLLLKLKFYEPA